LAQARALCLILLKTDRRGRLFLASPPRRAWFREDNGAESRERSTVMSERKPLPGGSTGYGSRLGDTLRADAAPAIVTRSPCGAEVAATEVRVDQPDGRLSGVHAPEDAYMIALALNDIPVAGYCEDARPEKILAFRAGETMIFDMRRGPRSRNTTPMRSVVWYLPKTTMDSLADEANVPAIGDLRPDGGIPVIDETMKHLGLSVLPALRTPDRATRLFTDHIAMALTTHAVHAFGGVEVFRRPVQGGLAAWQERRAKEMLASDLAGSTPLREVAAACELSTTYFSRAFRKSTGLAPYGWLIQARLDAAKAMLAKRDIPLAEIALACGFADQSHFTRVFTRRVGVSPGAWRRTDLR
jgi:AraC family transcriptional regulator